MRLIVYSYLSLLSIASLYSEERRFETSTQPTREWRRMRSLETPRVSRVILQLTLYIVVLKDVERCWKMLTDVERCWKMLKDVERCWKMLKDVERCWKGVEKWEQNSRLRTAQPFLKAIIASKARWDLWRYWYWEFFRRCVLLIMIYSYCLVISYNISCCTCCAHLCTVLSCCCRCEAFADQRLWCRRGETRRTRAAPLSVRGANWEKRITDAVRTRYGHGTSDRGIKNDEEQQFFYRKGASGEKSMDVTVYLFQRKMSCVKQSSRCRC